MVLIVNQIGNKMNEVFYKLTVAVITILGQLISIVVLVYQTFTNMFGAWFWFSLQATMGWGLLIALMNDTRFMITNSGRKAKK